MRYIFVLAAFFVFTLAAFAQPKLEIVGGDTYNWGNVTPKDSPLKADVKLKNAGTDTLHITRVKPTCGCTTAPLDKDRLAPEETATLNVSLRISNRSGGVHKSIRISSNDPKNEMAVLHLKADVKVEVEIGPTPYFVFRNMEVGKQSEASVKIINNSQMTLKVKVKEILPQNFSVNLPAEFALKPGESIEASGKVTPDKEGYFSAKVTLQTNHPDYEEISIPGYGNVKESKIFTN